MFDHDACKLQGLCQETTIDAAIGSTITTRWHRPSSAAFQRWLVEMRVLLISRETHAGLCRMPQVRAPDGDLVDYELFTVKSMEDVLLREWEIDPTDVRLMEKIGEGEFGQVFRVCVREPNILTFISMCSAGRKWMWPMQIL